jgi:dissimilatory sulfite reductase (desulfoviridin) alpha/beta subunit
MNTVNTGKKLSPEDIQRVKALGCLRDKRYDDVFNVRVITRNGRITAKEHHAIAEASERFGSGAVAMTTRLTMEIQGVKYENIEGLIAFLKEYNLETGGTGKLVRPIVSCKGTTCQFGLIDTFGLSEKIHERFYIGYHNVTLPHKFKIAVGGCPNNCVKPSLNDIGIIGQRKPIVDYSKCRGCKKCQIEAACPMKASKLVDGKIRLPLNAFQGVGDSAAQNIQEARKDGEFMSIDDLKTRARLTKTVIETLRENGCLKGLPETSQISLFDGF